ncbi:hypothetical protein GWK47_012633 [Chionoecetes opilio]|uniref:Uncharacterized protein n=1 Tax=Chionoecetes opilio TaxID=41210 RepID=A0A8J4XYY9_CHIOP|nr:hypothetical protein GWK47_012633 [Chionoecetes opilio]
MHSNEVSWSYGIRHAVAEDHPHKSSSGIRCDLGCPLITVRLPQSGSAQPMSVMPELTISGIRRSNVTTAPPVHFMAYASAPGLMSRTTLQAYGIVQARWSELATGENTS